MWPVIPVRQVQRGKVDNRFNNCSDAAHGKHYYMYSDGTGRRGHPAPALEKPCCPLRIPQPSYIWFPCVFANFK